MQKVKKIVVVGLAAIGAVVVGVVVATVGSGVAQGWGRPTPNPDFERQPYD